MTKPTTFLPLWEIRLRLRNQAQYMRDSYKHRDGLIHDDEIQRDILSLLQAEKLLKPLEKLVQQSLCHSQASRKRKPR